MYTQFVYRPSGGLLAVYSGALTNGTISLPGGSTAVYNAGGLNYIRHKDWLGSSRLATTWQHGVYSKEAYAPFGETYNEAGTPDRSFTGQDQNVVTGSGGSGAYDFLVRKYDPSAGRWLSPDPLGWGAVSPHHPQSLNRYVYVQNQPLTAVDPAGLDWTCVSVGDEGCESNDGTAADDGYSTDPAPATTPTRQCSDQAEVCVISGPDDDPPLGCDFDSGCAGFMLQIIQGPPNPAVQPQNSNKGGGGGGGKAPGTKQRQCDAIYDKYTQAVAAQKRKNAGTVAGAEASACAAGGSRGGGWLGCEIWAAAGGIATDVTLWGADWNLDDINLKYAIQLKNAGCSDPGAWNTD